MSDSSSMSWTTTTCTTAHNRHPFKVPLLWTTTTSRWRSCPCHYPFQILSGPRTTAGVLKLCLASLNRSLSDNSFHYFGLSDVLYNRVSQRMMKLLLLYEYVLSSHRLLSKLIIFNQRPVRRQRVTSPPTLWLPPLLANRVSFNTIIYSHYSMNT